MQRNYICLYQKEKLQFIKSKTFINFILAFNIHVQYIQFSFFQGHCQLQILIFVINKQIKIISSRKPIEITMYRSQRSRSHHSHRSNSPSSNKILKQPPPEIPSNQKQGSQYDQKKSKTSNNKKEYVKLGICAMKKKVQSKPMKQILSRLQTCKEIKIIEMWQYLETSYQTWPVVDALICFHSQGFPFVQAWRYVKKHKPLLINNLDKQQLLWDRTVVYDILKKIRVPVARNFMIFRDKNYIDEIQVKGNGPTFSQNDDQQQNGSQLPKIMKKYTVDARNSDNRSQQLKNRKSQSNNHNNNHLQEDKNSQNQKKHKVPESPDNEVLSPNSKQSPQKIVSISQQFIQSRNKSSSVEKDKKKQKRIQRSTSLAADVEDQAFETLKSSRNTRNSRNGQQKSLSRKAGAFRKRTQIDIIQSNNTKFPNTLRNFHQKRLKDLDDYTVQQIEDGVLIRSKKTDRQHKLKKPFVQKPFDSQNHHICIYYPQNMGGGRKILFRKVKNSSSQYQPNQSNIRTDANYIYEQYLQTNAFDIKVYTIGPYYMYAEARRSPTLDGVVDRDESGKQKRFPVILTPQQKFLCSKIVQEFQQDICGFDLLRAQGKSYVCDVNGWSFVKGNPKYWDDCAIILRRKIMKKFFPHLINPENVKYERFSNNEKNQYRPPMNRLSIKNQQLRSIVSIFRHGDRSPKLKMKIKTKDSRFLQFFKNNKKDQIKLKDAKSLMKILDITNQIIIEIGDITKAEFKDYSQMKSVLQSGGRFQGFNRKLQMKVIERGTIPDQQGNYSVKKLMLVLKWGGELSYLGYLDAVQLGKKMRQQRYDDDHDFLSLYSSYKHDLKTYSSDQGRCIKTAAAFLKGFLNISSSGLAPIITSMVNFTKKAQKLLDCSSQQNHSQYIEQIKHKLDNMMNSQDQLLQSYLKDVKQEQICRCLIEIIKEIGNPVEKLRKMHSEIGNLVEILQQLQFENWHTPVQNNMQSHQDQTPQTLIIIYKRWSKLQKDFYDKETNKFNISKIPEIYDNIRYDLKKNNAVFSQLDFKVQEFQYLAKILAYFVVPNQYGMTDQQKLTTAKQIVSPLLQKILIDLMFWKNKKYEEMYWKYKQSNQAEDNWKHIRTRLYFTSASHMYSIVNVICLGNNRQLLKNTPPQQAQKAINQLYMSYLSHIQFRLYENMVAQQNDPHRFRLQISISSEYKMKKPLKQFFLGGSHGFTIDQIQKFFSIIIGQKLQGKQQSLQKQRSKSHKSQYLTKQQQQNYQHDSNTNNNIMKLQKQKKKNKNKKKSKQKSKKKVIQDDSDSDD